MTPRRLHRVLGLVMLLPFAGWAVTGAMFFIKPGYGPAYEVLSIKTYAIDKPLTINPDPGWLEVRYLKTFLGWRSRSVGGIPIASTPSTRSTICSGPASQPSTRSPAASASCRS